MQTHAVRSRSSRDASATRRGRRRAAEPTSHLLQLQRTAGNQGVAALATMIVDRSAGGTKIVQTTPWPVNTAHPNWTKQGWINMPAGPPSGAAAEAAMKGFNNLLAKKPSVRVMTNYALQQAASLPGGQVPRARLFNAMANRIGQVYKGWVSIPQQGPNGEVHFIGKGLGGPKGFGASIDTSGNVTKGAYEMGKTLSYSGNQAHLDTSSWKTVEASAPAKGGATTPRAPVVPEGATAKGKGKAKAKGPTPAPPKVPAGAKPKGKAGNIRPTSTGGGRVASGVGTGASLAYMAAVAYYSNKLGKSEKANIERAFKLTVEPKAKKTLREIEARWQKQGYPTTKSYLTVMFSVKYKITGNWATGPVALFDKMEFVGAFENPTKVTRVYPTFHPWSGQDPPTQQLHWQSHVIADPAGDRRREERRKRRERRARDQRRRWKEESRHSGPKGRREYDTGRGRIPEY